jgi:hypothetical protein
VRLARYCICAAIIFNLAGCDDASIARVLEIRCVQNTGFDLANLCLKPWRAGAELGINVNVPAQKVQITVLKNDGNWWVKDLILDHCIVINSNNWKCTRAMGKPLVEEYNMLHGRYFHSLTGGSPPDYYTSSISGWIFWAHFFGIVNIRRALSMTGYSSEAMRSFHTQRRHILNSETR